MVLCLSVSDHHWDGDRLLSSEATDKTVMCLEAERQWSLPLQYFIHAVHFL